MRYFVLLCLVNLMWAFQFSGAKMATEQLGPVTVAFLPMALYEERRQVAAHA